MATTKKMEHITYHAVKQVEKCPDSLVTYQRHSIDAGMLA